MSMIRPFRRHLYELAVSAPGSRQMLRIYAVIGALVVLGYHILSRLTYPEAYDPLAHRLALAGGFLAILVASVVVDRFNKVLALALYAMITVLSLWSVWMAYKNGFSLDRSIALLMLVLGCALTFPRGRHLAVYLALVAGALTLATIGLESAPLERMLAGVQLLIFLTFIFFVARLRDARLTRLERLSLVARHTHAAVLLLDETGRPEWLNQVARRLLGPWEEALRTGDSSLLAAGEAERLRAFKSRLAAAKPFREEVQLTDLDGRSRWVELDVTAVSTGSRGPVLGHVVVGRDVTERKEAEKELRRSEGRYRRLVERSPMPILTLQNEEILQANRAASRLLRVSAPSLLSGASLVELVAETDRAAVRTFLERIRDEEGGSLDVRFERLDGGGTVEVTMQATSVLHAGQRLVQLVLTDLTERKQIERVKDDFVSTVNHELRTPLTSLRGSLGLLDAGIFEQGGERARMLVGLALRNTERLSLLINDLLDMQKIEAGKADFQLQSTDLGEVVRGAIEANQLFADRFGVTLRLVRALPGARVEVDPNRIGQVLANLLSNAAKFSPEGGVVDVFVDRVAQGLRVTVVDHGPGVPESFQDQLFAKFSRAADPRLRQVPGTGLGLAISRAIVEEHRGIIGLDRNYREGAAFYFVLPELVSSGPTAEGELEGGFEAASPEPAAATANRSATHAPRRMG